MSWLMNKPPKGLESLVAAHFREKAAIVLEACAAYATGRVKVGYYWVGCAAAEPGTYIVSASFKAWMETLYPILLAWFRNFGAQVGHIPPQLTVEAAAMPTGIKKKTTEKKKPIMDSNEKKKKAKKGSLSLMIFGVLKKIVCFKEMKYVSSQGTPMYSK